MQNLGIPVGEVSSLRAELARLNAQKSGPPVASGDDELKALKEQVMWMRSLFSPFIKSGRPLTRAFA